MQQLQLYIQPSGETNYQRIDLFEDESVSLTQSIQNVKDISKIFTDFSKSFSIPANKDNNKIFKHYYNFDITNGYDGRKKLNAKLELNNLPFKKGKIKLEGVDMHNNNPYSYKITFYGNTVDLKDILGEDKLSSLDSLDDLTLDYNNTTVKSKLTSAISDIIAPLITHSQRLFYRSNYAVFSEDNVHYDMGENKGVVWSELKYALRISKIIDAIEGKYGLSFSNDFFVNTNAVYENLFMWLHRKKGNVENYAQITQYPTLVEGLSSGSISEGTSVSNGRTLVLGNYPSNGWELTSFNFVADAGSTTAYDILITKDGQPYYEQTGISSANAFTVNLIGATAGDYVATIASNQAVAFDSVRWYVEIENVNTSQIETLTSESTNFQVDTTFDFKITSEIPEIKIIDFLTGLFKMFNLTAYVEDNGTIKVQPLRSAQTSIDDFYDNPEVRDITEYVDVNRSSVNVALPYKEIDFLYEDTESFIASFHNQQFGNAWAKESWNNSLDPNEPDQQANFDGEIYSVELPFSHFKYERLIDITNVSNTDIQWGYSVDDNRDPYIGKPLLFYPIRQTSATPLSFRDNDVTTSSLTSYIIPSNSLYKNSATGTQNINFFAEKNEYEGIPYTDTLFKVYYEDYIKDVFNFKRRLTKVKAFLPIKFLMNYTLADTLIISNRKYKINSITTNLNSGESELELLNVV